MTPIRFSCTETLGLLPADIAGQLLAQLGEDTSANPPIAVNGARVLEVRR